MEISKGIKVSKAIESTWQSGIDLIRMANPLRSVDLSFPMLDSTCCFKVLGILFPRDTHTRVSYVPKVFLRVYKSYKQFEGFC